MCIFFTVNFYNFLILSYFEMIPLSPDQHIKRISEGSCDTEDWSNDAKKNQLYNRNLNYILKYIKIEKLF